ncbi:MAG: hypothetical protein IT558_00260 [Alphaproteobacteria bacterium]|nr:hypothetical protein [Alphaproteobacteria bacterium]
MAATAAERDASIKVGTPVGPAFAGAVQASPVAVENIIERFERDLKESGVHYEARKNVASPAHFSPFESTPGIGHHTYLNTMYVDEKDRSRAAVEISRRHEGAHAILWGKLAAAHASPYNPAAPIVLCPRDWGRLMRNTERAAMAYNALLGFADTDANIKEAMKLEPGTAEDFGAAMKANSNNTEVALNRVARECLERNSNFYMLPTGKRTEKEALTLRNYYTWYSLKTFQDCERFNWTYALEDGPAPIFVRLGEEDILQMGELLGLNAFGRGRPDSFFTDQAPLMWKHQNWQNALNHRFGILNSDELPTVREALNDYFDITPRKFLEFSKSYKQGDTPLLQKRPVVPKLVTQALYM